MKKFQFLLFFLIWLGLCLKGQVAQFDQVYYSAQGSSGQNIWSGPSSTGYSKKAIMISKIGAVSMTSVPFTPYGNQNWIRVCLPSTSGNIDYGYMLCNEFYARINEVNNYAKVTTATLNIRTGAGTGNPNVTIGGSYATFGNNSIVALTGNSTSVSGVVWHEVYLTDNCIPQTGWLSSGSGGTLLSVNSNTTNYRIVGGRVCNDASSCAYLGDLGGATVTIGSYATILSSGEGGGNAGGYYEYKLPIDASAIITCSHPNYNISSPSSYSYSASSHNYSKNFVLSNTTCTYTLSQSSNFNVPFGGGSGYTFGVTAGTGCSWTASAGSYNWITINSGSGPGNGTCTYSVGSNPNTITRTGYITIQDKTFTVTQAAANVTCTYNLSQSSNLNVPFEGGSGFTFNVTAGAGCSWTASAGSYNWITINSSSGPGNGTCTYSVGSNPNTITRTGYITIQDKTFTVTQAAANTPPIADFYSNMNNIKPNTTVSFTDNSRNGASTWQWTFENGTPASSTSRNPTVVYTKVGGHRVTLTVSNISGTSSPKSIPAYITVSPEGTNQKLPAPKNDNASTQLKVVDPIQSGTGTYKYSHKDFNLPTVDGSIDFTRFYNTVNNTLNSPLGYGWSHSYNYYIDIHRDTETQIDTMWSLHYPDGHFADFIPLWVANPGTYPHVSFALYSGTLDSLVKANSNEFILYSKDNRQHHFNSSGQLTQITDLNGNATTINYTGSNISGVIGQGGRTLTLTYTGSYLSSVTETNNRKCYFTYDANGNLVTSQDPKGGITRFTYDVNHRMTTIVNCLGDAIVGNTFDTQGRVIKQIDAFNLATTLSYDTPSAGKTTITNPDNSQIIATHDQFFRKTNIIDELGLTTSFTYDDRSNETSFTNENGIAESRQFDWMGNVKTKTIGSNITSQYNYNSFNSATQITDPNGKSTAITYDGKNNPTAIHLPDNTWQYFTYNSNGTKNKFTDGRNNSTTYTYSSTGDMLSSIAPNGTKSYGYDPSGRLTSVTDENNHQTQMQYDDNDNIKILTDALLRTTEFTYDANNQLLSVKDKNGNLTTFSYDKKGRLKTNTNPKGGITTYTYDSRDNIVSITDPNSNVIGLTYDKKGRKLSITDALSATQYQYDGVGNRTKVTDGTGKATVFTYTLTNKIQSIKDGLMNSTTYTYDKNDNLISMINALNKTTVYSYNDMNRLVSVLDAANKTTLITYDENGNKKTITDPNGHAQSFNYDAANRLILHTDAAGNNNSYSYDQAGNILSTNTPTGTISKSYDYANRVLTITNSGGNNYTFTYDKNDNIATMSNSVGTSTMAYDNLNQLIQYTDPYNKTVSFTYDLMGNKTSITYPGNHKVNYQYDNAYNLKSVTDWLNKTFTYTYDAAGRNTQLIYPNGIKCDLVFDDAARLLSKKNTTSTNLIINSSQFVIDATGNRTSEQRQGPIPTYLIPSSKAYTYSNDDGMKTNGVWNYTNDASGNRTLETKGSKSVKYSFSVDNLLSNTIDTLGVTTTFNYDPLGHRLSKTAGSTQSRYILDLSGGLSKVLQITDANGAIKLEYVYGLGLLESIDASNNASFYHYDEQHNTVALSNQNAVITDTYTYDPFGTLLTHTGNATQPFTFLGEFGVEQESTSLYFVRARYYDAANGRFLSKDIYPGDLNNPQTINRYTYGYNNPIQNIDPTGLFSGDMYIAGVFQMLRGGAEAATSYLTGWSTALASSTGNPVFVGTLGLVSLKEANDAVKDFKAGSYNLINSFKKGNTIANAKFAEDADVSGIKYIDNLTNNPEAKKFIDAYSMASAIVSVGDLIGNVSNITTASKYLDSLHGFATKAIAGSYSQIIVNLKDIYDGVATALNQLNKSNCKK